MLLPLECFFLYRTIVTSIFIDLSFSSPCYGSSQRSRIRSLREAIVGCYPWRRKLTCLCNRLAPGGSLLLQIGPDLRTRSPHPGAFWVICGRDPDDPAGVLGRQDFN